MAIDNITSKIIYDAEREAVAISQEAAARREEILALARKEAEEKREAMRADGEAERAAMVERNVSVAKIDAGKLILEEKQILIERCLAEAVKKIANLDGDVYLKFLADTAKTLAPEGGELILNERDREKYGEKLEKLLEESGGGKYALSEETRKIKAGVIVKRGSVYVNGSVEARIDAMRSELVPEVAARLFK
jgi:V/A-type H+-transporting ATPase subunit E